MHAHYSAAVHPPQPRKGIPPQAGRAGAPGAASRGDPPDAPIGQGRVSSLALLAATLGTILGLIAGYFGGFLDELVMRFTDVLFAFPVILQSIGRSLGLPALEEFKANAVAMSILGLTFLTVS